MDLHVKTIPLEFKYKTKFLRNLIFFFVILTLTITAFVKQKKSLFSLWNCVPQVK